MSTSHVMIRPQGKLRGKAVCVRCSVYTVVNHWSGYTGDYTATNEVYKTQSAHLMNAEMKFMWQCRTAINKKKIFLKEYVLIISIRKHQDIFYSDSAERNFPCDS